MGLLKKKKKKSSAPRFSGGGGGFAFRLCVPRRWTSCPPALATVPAATTFAAG